jgi:hypothetical protein
VAGELLQQLEQGADPFGVLGGILAYFNLDGGQKYVGRTGIQRLRRAYHVSAHLPASGQVAWNHATMASLGASYAAEGGFLDYDATGTGCSSGACLHVSLINTRPHSPSAGGGVDYTDFAGRPVNTWWLDARQEEAGLGLCATAFTLEEGLLERYAQLGGCRSPLGEPRSGASPTADGEGRVARFERGALQGRPGRGPYAVVEPVYGAWAVRGLEMGELGHPVADTVRVPGGVRGQFERGTLVVHDDGRVEQQGSADAGEAPADAGSPPQDLPGPVLGAGSPQPGDGEAAGGCSASGDGTGAWAAAAWGWVQWLWLRRGAPQWRRSRGTAGGR